MISTESTVMESSNDNVIKHDDDKQVDEISPTTAPTTTVSSPNKIVTISSPKTKKKKKAKRKKCKISKSSSTILPNKTTLMMMCNNDEDTINKRDHTCSICYETINHHHHQYVMMLLPCEHYEYCCNCIFKLLTTTTTTNVNNEMSHVNGVKCPMCRGEIYQLRWWRRSTNIQQHQDHQDHQLHEHQTPKYNTITLYRNDIVLNHLPFTPQNTTNTPNTSLSSPQTTLYKMVCQNITILYKFATEENSNITVDQEFFDKICQIPIGQQQKQMQQQQMQQGNNNQNNNDNFNNNCYSLVDSFICWLVMSHLYRRMHAHNVGRLMTQLMPSTSCHDHQAQQTTQLLLPIEKLSNYLAWTIHLLSSGGDLSEKVTMTTSESPESSLSKIGLENFSHHCIELMSSESISISPNDFYCNAYFRCLIYQYNCTPLNEQYRSYRRCDLCFLQANPALITPLMAFVQKELATLRHGHLLHLYEPLLQKLYELLQKFDLQSARFQQKWIKLFTRYATLYRCEYIIEKLYKELINFAQSPYTTVDDYYRNTWYWPPSPIRHPWSSKMLIEYHQQQKQRNERHHHCHCHHRRRRRHQKVVNESSSTISIDHKSQRQWWQTNRYNRIINHLYMIEVEKIISTYRENKFESEYYLEEMERFEDIAHNAAYFTHHHQHMVKGPDNPNNTTTTTTSYPTGSYPQLCSILDQYPSLSGDDSEQKRQQIYEQILNELICISNYLMKS